MAKSKNVKEEVINNIESTPTTSTVVDTTPTTSTVVDTTPNTVTTAPTTSTEAEQKVEESKVSSTSSASTQPASNGPTYDELMDMVRSLASEVSALKSNQNQTQTQSQSQSQYTSSDSTTNKILEMLSGRKSDREVVLVHNREMLGGLTTHLNLPNLTIDFTKMGEQRVLTWQQFEQCVSNYRSFFEEEIIKLGEGQDELADRYGVPCVKSTSGHIMTRNEIDKLGDLSIRELEDYYNSLSETDKAFLCSYWLGKCYTREPKFYDRGKIETLNRLGGTNKDNEGIFDTLLALMNNDFRNKQ